MIPIIKLGLKRWRPQQMLHSMSNVFRRYQCECRDVECKLPTRKEHMKSLREDDFDVLVVGGGAVGCGCALEAASRGLKTALIEANDFGSGASCKSSKLVEGGSSYLQAAIQGADLQQIFMLQQVLAERAIMLRIAPHLNRVQPMLMPIYSPLRLPFYWLGLKLYDAMAGKANVRASHFISREETLNEFPLLRRKGLLGSLVYYDGQMDDARMCLALALTAIKNDATVVNYVKLCQLLPTEEETKCRKAIVVDTLSDTSFVVNSRCLINATGAGTDVLRKLDECRVSSIALPKLGTHISLPSHFGSTNCGMLFPGSKLHEDAMFMLPFENRVLVGSLFVEPEDPNYISTKPKCDVVDCLLHQTRDVLNECALLRPDHVLSAWTGAMPAIMCPDAALKEKEKEKDIEKEKTNENVKTVGKAKLKPKALDEEEDKPQQEFVPNFLVEVSGNQMITLAGGRWSSYRVMASDAIDAAIEHCCLEPQVEVSSTQNLLLDGAEDFCNMLPIELLQNYEIPMDVAQHLADSYGSNALQVLQKTTQFDREKLHPQFPYIKAEVDYACKREYACHLIDVVARRLRVAFVDASAAFQILPSVMEIMSKHLNWDDKAKEEQLDDAKDFLMHQMGLGSIVKYTPLVTGDTKPQKKDNNESEFPPKPSCCPAPSTCRTNDVKPHYKCENEQNNIDRLKNRETPAADHEKRVKKFEVAELGSTFSSCAHQKGIYQSYAPRRDFGSLLNTNTGSACRDICSCTNDECSDVVQATPLEKPFKTAKFKTSKFNNLEYKASEYNNLKLKTPEFNNRKFKATELYNRELKTPQLKTPELNSAMDKTPEHKTTVIKTPVIKTPVIKTPEDKTTVIKTPVIKTPELKTTEKRNPQVKTPETKISELKTPENKTQDVKTPMVKTPIKKTTAIKAPEVKASEVKTPKVKTQPKAESTKPESVQFKTGKTQAKSKKTIKIEKTNATIPKKKPGSIANLQNNHNNTTIYLPNVSIKQPNSADPISSQTVINKQSTDSAIQTITSAELNNDSNHQSSFDNVRSSFATLTRIQSTSVDVNSREIKDIKVKTFENLRRALFEKDADGTMGPSDSKVAETKSTDAVTDPNKDNVKNPDANDVANPVRNTVTNDVTSPVTDTNPITKPLQKMNEDIKEQPSTTPKSKDPETCNIKLKEPNPSVRENPFANLKSSPDNQEERDKIISEKSINFDISTLKITIPELSSEEEPAKVEEISNSGPTWQDRERTSTNDISEKMLNRGEPNLRNYKYLPTKKQSAGYSSSTTDQNESKLTANGPMSSKFETSKSIDAHNEYKTYQQFPNKAITPAMRLQSLLNQQYAQLEQADANIENSGASQRMYYGKAISKGTNVPTNRFNSNDK